MLAPYAMPNQMVPQYMAPQMMMPAPAHIPMMQQQQQMMMTQPKHIVATMVQWYPMAQQQQSGGNASHGHVISLESPSEPIHRRESREGTPLNDSGAPPSRVPFRQPTTPIPEETTGVGTAREAARVTPPTDVVHGGKPSHGSIASRPDDGLPGEAAAADAAAAARYIMPWPASAHAPPNASAAERLALLRRRCRARWATS